ncbi:HEAT repeat-containing protein 3-like [Physella acuta]|uniref:HEAT repeat-containing protein 3-like n=1 Tax=Physella acuta TaxID=109671 RepID=UPI0027DD733E|nr:HEAT repeat-containing protein 3-like [Physella acuta]
MGKNKTKRFGAMKPNPTGIVSEKELDLEAELSGDHDSVPSSISNIVEKLQSPDTEERACGCQLMASIVSQPKAIGYLLKENVVKITAPLFLDSCLEVQKNALGALRNMSVYGHSDVCEVMIDNDILTPLTALIKEFGNGWIPQKDTAKSDTRTDVLIEAMELLSNLCESHGAAVKWFNKEKLVVVLLPMLKPDVFGYSLSIAVARCLHIVSENNPEVSVVCQQQEVVSQLLQLIAEVPSGIDAVLLKTYAIGIVMNLSEVDLTAYYKGIVTTIVGVLDLDSYSVLDTAIKGSEDAAENASHESDVTWPEVDKLLSAQAVSLELLANLCCSGDEWEDQECSGSGESSDDQAMEAESMDDVDDDSTANALCLPSEITSVFAENDILTKVLQKAAALSVELIAKLGTSSCGRNTLKKLKDLQTRALLCFSNIVGALDESLISESTLTTIWASLYSLVSTNEGSSDGDFSWAVTNAMRAVIQRLSDIHSASFCDMKESDLDFIVGLAKDGDNRETQINVVKIISTIGCILSAEPSPILKKIGTVLLEVASNNADIVVVSEALDSLFDVFKEDNTNQIAKDIGLVDKLRSMQPSFRTKVSSQRKKFGENYAVVMTAKANLSGFIKYKLSHS